MASSNSPIPNRCMPVAEWPPTDRIAWQEAFRPGTPFKPGGPAARWAPTTSALIENGYGRFLTWLQWHDMLDFMLSPGERVIADRVAKYVADLGTSVSSFSVYTRVQQLGNAMRAMAPSADWRWLLRGADRLRACAVSVRDKRARLQSPDRLVALGMTLMTAADAAVDELPVMRAKIYRDGLMIALLAQRPVRARNFGSITRGEHLLEDDDLWWLIFTDTKTKRTLEMTFPSELIANLEHYILVYRPVLIARGHGRGRPATAALWISSHGTAMGTSAIAHQIRARTRTAFGTAVNPHCFRDCAATSIAINRPEHVRAIPDILGHADLTTSERHYNLAGSLDAGRRHHATLAALRRRSKFQAPK